MGLHFFLFVKLSPDSLLLLADQVFFQIDNLYACPLKNNNSSNFLTDHRSNVSLECQDAQWYNYARLQKLTTDAAIFASLRVIPDRIIVHYYRTTNACRS